MMSCSQPSLPTQSEPVSAEALEDQVSDADRAFLASALKESMDTAKAGEVFTPDERYFERKRHGLHKTDKV
jgi:predicted transcriptional regulator